MMTEYEVQKLQQSMDGYLDAGPTSVWKCVAGLLIIIAYLAASNWLGPTESPSFELAQIQAQVKYLPPHDDY